MLPTTDTSHLTGIAKRMAQAIYDEIFEVTSDTDMNKKLLIEENISTTKTKINERSKI